MTARAHGQIALPFVLLVGGIIAEIVIAGSVVSFFASASSAGEQLSLRALSAAYAGVYDGIMRISSNKETASAGTVNYSLSVGDDSVSISISRTVDDPLNVYEYTVAATASARNRRRKVVGDVVVEQTTGVLDIVSVEEAAL